MKKFILYSMLFGIFFVSFDRVNPYKEELNADISEYVYEFNEKSIDGEKIVLFDNRGLEDIQYYVYEFSSNQYVVYGYYFMNDHESYMKKYEEAVDKIVDYNYDEYMIKTINYINYGTYNEVMSALYEDLNNNKLYMIY